MKEACSCCKTYLSGQTNSYIIKSHIKKPINFLSFSCLWKWEYMISLSILKTNLQSFIETRPSSATLRCRSSLYYMPFAPPYFFRASNKFYKKLKSLPQSLTFTPISLFQIASQAPIRQDGKQIVKNELK